MRTDFIVFGVVMSLWYRPDSLLNPYPAPDGYGWAQLDADSPYRLFPLATPDQSQALHDQRNQDNVKA